MTPVDFSGHRLWPLLNRLLNHQRKGATLCSTVQARTGQILSWCISSTEVSFPPAEDLPHIYSCVNPDAQRGGDHEKNVLFLCHFQYLFYNALSAVGFALPHASQPGLSSLCLMHQQQQEPSMHLISVNYLFQLTSF